MKRRRRVIAAMSKSSAAKDPMTHALPFPLTAAPSTRTSGRKKLLQTLLVCWLMVCATAAMAQQQLQPQPQVLQQRQATQQMLSGGGALPSGGPIKLPRSTDGTSVPAAKDVTQAVEAPANDFEQYVNSASVLGAGRSEGLRRFGSGLWSRTEGDSQDGSPLVPDDYVLQTGDEITISVWGSVDADLRLQIDRSGRVNVPRVGAITLMGVRYADLASVLSRKFDQVFKNYKMSAGLAHLRGIRIYMSGFVNKPGAYTVSSLSSVANALAQAGGPSAAGSMRTVTLKRGREPLVTIDLYDILLKGDRTADRLVQPEDVIYVGPIGKQVAVVGSVNLPAIFELKASESISDLLQMSGGFSTVADRSRLTIERLANRNAGQVVELKMPADETSRLENGDVVRAFSKVEAVLPSQQKNKLVMVDGEVHRPGEFLLPAASTVNDALRAAGGLTASAYVYATEFSRRSVQIVQRTNYERVIRDLESQLTRTTSTQRLDSPEDAAAMSVNRASAERFINSLRQIQPTGRVVLELAPTASALPDLALEDGDRIYVPPKQSTVGVFGSVFNAGSYLFRDGRRIGDYLGLAGGPSKGADPGSIIVLRANGSVTAATQQAGWLSQGSLDSLAAQAGDTIFVPEEFNKESFRTLLKDWTAIIYNFGLGAAGIKAVFR